MAKPKTKRDFLDALKDEFNDDELTMKSSKQVMTLRYKKMVKDAKKAEAKAIEDEKAKVKAKAKAEAEAPAPKIVEDVPAPKIVEDVPAPVVDKKTAKSENNSKIEKAGRQQHLDKKLELVKMLQSTGITEAHTEMSVPELKKLYKAWQVKQGQKGKDKTILESVNAMINETENKIVVERGKSGLIFPKDFRQARREDIGWLKVSGKVLTIVYKAGPKVNYDVRSCKQI